MKKLTLKYLHERHMEDLTRINKLEDKLEEFEKEKHLTVAIVGKAAENATKIVTNNIEGYFKDKLKNYRTGSEIDDYIVREFNSRLSAHNEATKNLIKAAVRDLIIDIKDGVQYCASCGNKVTTSERSLWDGNNVYNGKQQQYYQKTDILCPRCANMNPLMIYKSIERRKKDERIP